MSRGISFPFGSTKESLAMWGYRRELEIQFSSVMALISTITFAGSAIGGGSPKQDSLNKAIDSLKSLMFPEDEEQKRQQTERFLSIIEEEVSKGPLKVQAMSHKARKRKKK